MKQNVIPSPLTTLRLIHSNTSTSDDWKKLLSRKRKHKKHDSHTHTYTPTPLYKEDKIILWWWQWKMANSRANTGTMIDHGNTRNQQKVKLDDKCVHTNVHLWVWVGGLHIYVTVYVCVCMQDMATCQQDPCSDPLSCIQVYPICV